MNMEPVDLFYSYAHEDEKLRDELDGHLALLRRKGVIRPWHDRGIVPGQKWDEAIDRELSTADLILLLVSMDFLNSDYIWGKELATAIARAERGDASVIPVLLRAVEAIQQRWASTPPSAPAAPAAPRSSDFATATASAAPPDDTGAVAGAARSLRSVGLDSMQEARTDGLIQRMVGGFANELSLAARVRGMADIDSAEAEDMAAALIDMPEQKRVLWVDDKPEANHHEVAALAKLQIEVVTAHGTDDALARLDSDEEGFDLVLSDWSRPEALDGAPSAGLKLLRALAARPRRLPVIFYHGEFDAERRAARRDTLLRAGAFGEAVSPGELLAQVRTALQSA